MATQVVTTTEYTDDLTGGKAEATVVFGFDGQVYEIDLGKANTRALEKTIAPYIGAARKIRASRTKAVRTRAARTNAAPTKAVLPTAGTHDLAAIRTWARSHGYQVSDRGRIAAAVIAAYEAAE